MRRCGTLRRSGPICPFMSFWAAKAVLRSLPIVTPTARPSKRPSNNVSKFVEAGWKHVRIQLGGYGSPHLGKTPDFKGAGFGQPTDQYQENEPYIKGTLKLFEF